MTIHHRVRIGLLGGTFDPPHNGHLLLGRAAYEQLNLDHLLLLPVGDPTHKSRPDLSTVHHRVSMTVLASADRPGFALNLTDITRPEPHYTSTLLPEMQAQYPTADFWLVVGGDSLRDFHKWHKPETILSLCRLAVLPRPGADIDWDVLKETLPTIQSRVDMLDGTILDLSSTQLRQADHNQARAPWVPTTVLRYIQQHQLYKLSSSLARSVNENDN